MSSSINQENENDSSIMRNNYTNVNQQNPLNQESHLSSGLYQPPSSPEVQLKPAKDAEKFSKMVKQSPKF